MSINAVAVALEVAFGFGPNSSPAPGDWVDITAYLDVTASSAGILAVSGRDSGRSGISPGSLNFTLENADGRFNPSNASGPYYGLLDNGALIRVRVTYASVTTTRWLGFINSGWPQTITSRYPTVSVTAQDVLGLISQGIAPETGFDAMIKELETQPDYWFQAGPTGWLDIISGNAWKHTGGLTKFDSIVDGRDGAWGQLEADGHGVVDDTLVFGSDGNTIVVSAWIDLSYIFNTAGVIFPILNQASVYPASGHVGESFSLTIQSQLVGTASVITLSAGFGEQVAGIPYLDAQIDSRYSGNFKFSNGKQHIMFAFKLPYLDPDPFVSTEWWSPDVNVQYNAKPTVPQFFGMWINGELSGQYGYARSPLVGLTNTLPKANIGGYEDVDSSVVSSANYKGIIDEVMVWKDHPSSFDELGVIANSMWYSANSPWADEQLNQRVDRLVSSFGLSSNIGALDVSAIVTQQSYRKSPPIDLLQKVEDTEQGRIFVDREGDIRFSNRQWAWDAAVSNTVQLTFSDDPTLIAGGAQDMLESGTVITDDPFNLVNVASVTSTFGTMQSNENAASITKYGRRNPISLSGLLHSSDRQSYAVAEWLLLSQGTPQIQAKQISFRVEDNPSVLAPFARAVEEGWLVRVVKTTSGENLDIEAHVIGITHEWTFGGWTVTLTLDATRTGYTFFKWGTSTWGGSDGWSF